MSRVALLLTVLLVAGCAARALPYPPTLSVPLPENEFGTFQLDIYDDSGLVLSGRPGDQVLGGFAAVDVVAIPERSELLITWTGGACGHRPFVEIRGTSEDLRLVVAPNPAEYSLAPVSCPAIGIVSSATLSLAEPVSQENITFTGQM
jgi:hypothetical protein